MALESRSDAPESRRATVASRAKALKTYLGLLVALLIIVTLAYSYFAYRDWDAKWPWLGAGDFGWDGYVRAMDDIGFQRTVIPILGLGSLGFLYLLPVFVADVRRHKYAGRLFLLNLFLGWTVVAWFILLVWALLPSRGRKPFLKETVQAGHEIEQRIEGAFVERRSVPLALIECAVCGNSIATDARACPHCGHPLRKRRQYHWVRWSAAACAVLVIVFIIRLWHTSNQYNATGIPICNSTTAEQDVRSTIKNSPAGRSGGLEIISFTKPETVSEYGTNGSDCRAEVSLNDGRDVRIDFSYRRAANGDLIVSTVLH